MVGVGRHLCGSSSPTPLPKQGHLQQAAETLSRRILNISREGDSTASLGSLFQCSVTLRGKKFFLMFSWNFLCFSLCPLPLVLSVGTTEKSLAPWKVRTHEQERIQTLWNERRRFLPLRWPPFINWVWHLWYEIFPLASWAVRLAVLRPSSSTAAHELNMGDRKKVLDLIEAIESIGVTIVLLKSKTQHLLRGKLTLFQDSLRLCTTASLAFLVCKNVLC